MRSFIPVLLVLNLFVSAQLTCSADDLSALKDAVSAETKDATQEPEAKSPPVSDDAASKLSKEELTQLELLENHFFGRVHPSEILDRRIERLERFVFGTQGSGTEYGARLDKLSATLSSVDPDGKKRVITIAPTAPSQPPADAKPPSAPPQSPQTSYPSQISGLPTAVSDSTNTPDSGSDKSQSDQPKPSDENRRSDDFYKVTPVASAPLQPSLAGQVRNELRQSEVAGVLHCNKDLFPVDGAPAQAIRELSMAIKVHPTDPELMFERAKAEMLLNKIDNALSDLSDAIMNNPNRSLYYLARAWCYKQSGNSVLANDDLKQAKFVDPGLPAKIDFLPATANSDTSKTQ